jgi:hypothetical protein
MDQLLGGLFGGQDDDDRRRGRAQDFVSRYEQGPPYEGISDEEAYHNYRQVAGRLSPQEYEESAAEAFQRLSPQERMQFAQMLQQRAGGQFGGFQGDDPRELARVMSGYRQQDPGGLASLFRGGGGGMGDLLNNPLAKAAIGGMAAMAMKRMMGGR